MIVKKTGYYVLKVLLYMVFSNKKQCILRDLSDDLGISGKTLEHVLLRLKRSGFLSSKRGPNGGYVLIKDPSSMSVWEVLKLTGHEIEILPLDHGKKSSSLEKVIDEMVVKIEDGLLSKLEEIKIGDLNEEMLKKVARTNLNFSI